MELIADSGSTKTDWAFFDRGSPEEVSESGGLNPNFTSDEEFFAAFRDLPVDPAQVRKVWFYGAGCGREENRRRVVRLLSAHFGSAEFNVYTDMMGAARALCQNRAGMAAILGTGMNACIYNGEEIVQNHFSLGFILGDEGSGACLGKLLIREYLLDNLPRRISTELESDYALSKGAVMDAVYRKPHPNRFLAGFARFMKGKIHEPFIRDLVTSAFDDFFLRQVLTYPRWSQYELHLTGSVAWHFRELLCETAAKHQVRIGTVCERPISQLVSFHRESPA